MPRTLLFCDLDLQFHGYWWPLKGHIFAHFGPVLIFSFSETEMLTDRQKTNKQRNYTNFESYDGSVHSRARFREFVHILG